MAAVAGKRIAVWCHGVPHPTEGASTVLFWHYVAGLRRAGFDVLSVLLVEDERVPSGAVEAFRASAGELGIAVAACHAPSFLEERRHAVRLRSELLGPAVEAVGSFGAQASFALDLVAAWAARATAAPRVVWLGDLRFDTVWYHALYAARERRTAAVQLPLVLLRVRAWRRAYREALAGAARIVVSSSSSVAGLRRLGLESEYQPYPWPAEPPEPRRPPVLPTFLFLGTLQALGSRSAFHMILDDLYPELVRRWGSGGFRILIAGRGGLPSWAAAAVESRPELEHLGFVEDLPGLLAGVHAAIAPISVPVGNRSRILTALAAETVVVAHENAALGNPELVDGDTCYLADDAAEFVERMTRTVELPEDAAQVARRGRELYERRFRPDVAVRAAADTLASVLPTAPSAVDA